MDANDAGHRQNPETKSNASQQSAAAASPKSKQQAAGSTAVAARPQSAHSKTPPPPQSQTQPQPLTQSQTQPQPLTQTQSQTQPQTSPDSASRKSKKYEPRKTPEEYRETVLVASSPSQISEKSITEEYKVPSPDFQHADDVFEFRGYRKLSKIDEGTFGVVSKALRKSDNVYVAVKEISLRRRRHKRIEEMKRELFVLQRIEHTNVTHLIEHFIVGNTLVIIMEFCSGGNLVDFLRENILMETDVMGLFSQMASAVKMLHRNGIAHRDIKLNNFLLDSTRKIVKIGDFGLSTVTYRRAQGLLYAKTYCGTEPYMAPEMMRRLHGFGGKTYNPLAVDIWALGVCLYALLTHTFPFKNYSTPEMIIEAQMTRRWRFPRFRLAPISETVIDLVTMMLDPDHHRRITINGVITHQFLVPGKLSVKLSYVGQERAVRETPINRNVTKFALIENWRKISSCQQTQQSQANWQRQARHLSLRCFEHC